MFDNGVELLKFLLTRTNTFEITKEVLVSAAGNIACGESMITFILETFQGAEITDSVLESAVSNQNYGRPILEMLLAASPNLQIKEETFRIAVGTEYFDDGLVELLLERCPNIDVTEKLLCAAAKNGSPGIMDILLQQPRAFTISQELLRLASGDWAHGEQMVWLLLGNAPGMQPFDDLIYPRLKIIWGLEFWKG